MRRKRYEMGGLFIGYGLDKYVKKKKRLILSGPELWKRVRSVDQMK